MKEDTKGLMQTYSGINVDLVNPDIYTILVPDIAHHLSNICRYTGACRKFYSVAQHCCLVSKLIGYKNPDLQLEGLLHDASESYLTDVSTVLKRLLPDYIALEDNMQQAIIKRFGLKTKDFSEVKFYDMLALSIESKVLMGPRSNLWSGVDRLVCPNNYEYTNIDEQIQSWTPERAEQEYLREFDRLWMLKGH